MQDQCPNCRWTIVELNLTEGQRRELSSLLQENKKLHAVKYLRETLPVELVTAKGMVMHLDAVYGQCVNCTCTQLVGERCFCPQCGSFNYNLEWDQAASE